MKVRDMFPLEKTGGEVGIEVEMEGDDLPTKVTNWRVTEDGSLRGRGLEYVLRTPVKRSEVTGVLKSLHDTFQKSNSRLRPSDRCGVHVHLNVQEHTFEETMIFIILYLAVEDLMVKYCGEDREGNLFCLRARDAEGLIQALIRCVFGYTFHYVQNNAYRYASMNLCALSKYGSIEFRSLGTPADVRDIENWVSLLLKVKDAAKMFHRPSDVVEHVSQMGSDRFLMQIFGDMAELIQCPEQEWLLTDGVRRVQDLAYLTPRLKDLQGAHRMDFIIKHMKKWPPDVQKQLKELIEAEEKNPSKKQQKSSGMVFGQDPAWVLREMRELQQRDLQRELDLRARAGDAEAQEPPPPPAPRRARRVDAARRPRRRID